jgi:hypothetical protein
LIAHCVFPSTVAFTDQPVACMCLEHAGAIGVVDRNVWTRTLPLHSDSRPITRGGSKAIVTSSFDPDRRSGRRRWMKDYKLQVATSM